MTLISPPVEIRLLTSGELDRFLIRYTCGANEVIVSFPHPRESIWLTRDDAQLQREFFPFIWGKPDSCKLAPGEVLFASVCLVPYWTGIVGEVDIECDIEWKLPCDDKWSVTHVKERVEVKLPTREEIKRSYRDAVRSGQITPETPSGQQIEVLPRGVWPTNCAGAQTHETPGR